jgi:hypothetical protein
MKVMTKSAKQQKMQNTQSPENFEDVEIGRGKGISLRFLTISRLINARGKDFNGMPATKRDHKILIS